MNPSTRQSLYVGIKGAVLALDAATGTELWRTELTGSSFVNLVRMEDRLLATTRGEIYCLDSATGQICWHNPLKGLGLGLVTIATDFGSAQAAISAEHLAQEQAAASSASAAAVGATVAASTGASGGV